MDNLLNWANAKMAALIKLEDVKPENILPCLKVGVVKCKIQKVYFLL